MNSLPTIWYISGLADNDDINEKEEEEGKEEGKIAEGQKYYMNNTGILTMIALCILFWKSHFQNIVSFCF